MHHTPTQSGASRARERSMLAGMPHQLARLAITVMGEIRSSVETGLDPFRTGRFEELAIAIYSAQRQHVDIYGRWCDALNVHNVQDWSQIPALPATAFKRCRVAAHRPGADVHVWHSSATTGTTPSQHCLPSGEVYDASMLAAGRAALVPDYKSRRLRVIQLAPCSADAPNSSLVHMFDSFRDSFGDNGGAFGNPDFSLDVQGARNALQRAVDEDAPVLLLATSFALVELFDATQDESALQLPPGSRAMDTGGYKGRTREVSRDELCTLVGRRLGVAPAMVENEYGASELSSQAYLGNIAAHLGRELPGLANATSGLRWNPPWMRTRVVHPTSLQEVYDGETGIVVHHDLANVFTCAAIRTQDVAVRSGNSYRLVGRAAGSELRGCSLLSEAVR